MTKPPAVQYRSLSVSVSTPEHGALWSKTFRETTIGKVVGAAKNAVRKGAARAGQTAEYFVINVRDAGEELLQSNRYRVESTGRIAIVPRQLPLL